MTLVTIIIALLWGAVVGYLAPRVLDSLIGILFCLHGLLLVHWKRLANKAATGLIQPVTLLSVVFWLALPLLLFGSILALGYKLTRSEFGFNYHGGEAIILLVVACAVAASQLPAMWRRLQVNWKMSHAYDYAERRKRTRMLRF